MLAQEVDTLKKEQKELQNKVNDITMMLCVRIEENNALQGRIEQLTAQNH